MVENSRTLATNVVFACYVSVSSKPDYPSGKFPRNVFERANSPLPPPGHKESEKPDLWGRKIVLKPYPRAIIFKNQAKNTKHEIEMMKNSTEMLICLEILKQ